MNQRHLFGYLLLVTLVFFSQSGTVMGDSSDSHTITDMVGRTMSIPDSIDGVLTTYPPTTTMVYMIAPDLLMGWNYQISETYVPEKYAALPMVGGWQTRSDSNYETFAAMKPDLVFEGYTPDGVDANKPDIVNERQEKFGDIPVVAVTDIISATKFTGPIRFMGEILHHQSDAENLVSFYEEAMDTVKTATGTIPEDQKVSVYIAGGADGLSTDLYGSRHGELIDICGGYNVARSDSKEKVNTVPEMAQLSMEQIGQWNPDVILVRDPTFFGKISTDPLWKSLKAVQDGRVYLIPSKPFAWVGRPPSTNQIIGLYWMLHVLYPETYSMEDLKEKTRYFYKTFFHYDLTDDDLADLLEPVRQ